MLISVSHVSLSGSGAKYFQGPVLSVLHQVLVSHKIFQLSAKPEESKTYPFHQFLAFAQVIMKHIAIHLVSGCPLGALLYMRQNLFIKDWVLFPVGLTSISFTSSLPP